MDAALETTKQRNLLIQEKNQRRKERQLQKRLRDPLKRQKKMEYERKRQNARFRKLKKEQMPRLRLLSDEEINAMAHRIQNVLLSDEEQEEIFRKHYQHLSEKSQRQRALKRQHKEV